MLRGVLLSITVVIAVGVCGAQEGDGPPKRAVTGTVVSLDGSPVPTASVLAIPLREVGSGGTVGSQVWLPADGEGRFRIVLAPGRYQIRAKDEAAGYPDPSFLLSHDPSARFPEISVSAADVSGVHVMLGTRGGIVEGEVYDQRTQRPIPKAKVTVSDVRNPDAYVEVFTNDVGAFHFTVPSRDVLISATAAGHSRKTFGEGMILSGGERRHIVVELESQSEPSPR
jgi:hypothetical protein